MTRFVVRALACEALGSSGALVKSTRNRLKPELQTWACAALFALSACGKKSTSPSESPTPSQAAPPIASKASDSAATAIPAEIDYSKTLDRLTQAVRKYAAETRSAPKSLNEVAAAGYIPEVPAAPAGKQFVIDGQLRVRLK
jgi:hypothetical protein